MVNTNLVSIKINNIPLQVPAGTRILDACRDNGFHVPYLCYPVSYTHLRPTRPY